MRARFPVLFALVVAALPATAGAQDDASIAQAELAAIGFFGASGELSPGARANFEARPWGQFGATIGTAILSTTTASSFGDISGLRLAGDVAGTIHHVTGSITSSAAVGARFGAARFELGELSSGFEFYSQLVFRGRGEWSFARHWYLPFQMELAFALSRADLKVNGSVADEVRGLEADLSLGIGYRF